MSSRSQGFKHGIDDIFRSAVDGGCGAGEEVECVDEVGGCNKWRGLAGVEEKFGVGDYGSDVLRWL